MAATDAQSAGCADRSAPVGALPCHNCLHLCLPGQQRCPECGAVQKRAADDTRAGVAGVLSFLIPGLGHFFLARPIHGLLWMLITPVVWWWALGSVSGSFFVLALSKASAKSFLFRGAVLLYHALAAVHAIHLGQPRHETGLARAARAWLLRLGLLGIAAIFGYTHAYPRLRSVWAVKNSQPSITLATAPTSSAKPSEPFFEIRIRSFQSLPEGGAAVGLTIKNVSPWMIERGAIRLGAADASGSVLIAYLNPGDTIAPTVVVKGPPGWMPKGFAMEALDIQTTDGRKECTIAYDKDCILLRLMPVEPLADGRFLATFRVYNLRSESIPAGTYCQLSATGADQRRGRSEKWLVLPEIPAGGVGLARIAFDAELTDFDIASSGRAGLGTLDKKGILAAVLKYQEAVQPSVPEGSQSANKP